MTDDDIKAVQNINEYQELTVDDEGRVIGVQGGLFRYKEIGRVPVIGWQLGDVLDSFWNGRVKAICRETLESGRTLSTLVELMHNGSRLSLEFITVPRVEDDRISGLVLTVRDVTVPLRLKRHEALREKMKVVGRLAAQIVHSMNNPIAAILNSIGGILVQEPEKIDVHELRRELAEIQEQLYQIAVVTNALTAFSGSGNRDFKLIQLNRIVESTHHLLQLLYAQKEIRYRLELDENLPRILGNEVTLEQALINICSNAVEAMPERGELSIITRVDDQFRDFVNIVVSDTGIGIPAEALDDVFEPFYTTKEGHRGLGLTVCYGIISNHNGNIELTSQPGAGTTVTVMLPVAKV